MTARFSVPGEDDGKLWSFLRRVLEQGSAIQQDYTAGKYRTYEDYAARIDEAARERADEWRVVQWNASPPAKVKP